MIARDSLQFDTLEKIRSRCAKVGIVGLGYVGLPLALLFSEGGLASQALTLMSRKWRRLTGAGPIFTAYLPLK